MMKNGQTNCKNLPFFIMNERVKFVCFYDFTFEWLSTANFEL